ncbi:activator of basal transcription 1-like [Penaeus japonicus]|uniref:activator of basal transcription 1-like n=1 Tax=Penaeus japonicus TaxID=27405 RepID=UPI001C715830|nr:activator of basal transcription 1-like [Penaeus japonicus]
MEDTETPMASSADTTLSDEDIQLPVKRRKPGIVYLSIIPPNMNVTDVREYFSNFGEVDRMFLQAGNEEKKKTEKWKKKKRQRYTEGWIEFKSKRKAKEVQLLLNNQPVGGKKRNPYYDMLWNIKYLPRFKWAFLKQRLEYEREVHRQRMAAEISQVRRETDHFIKASEISAKQKKKEKAMKKKEKSTESNNNESANSKEEDKGEKSIKKKKPDNLGFVFKQKLTEDEIVSKKESRKLKDEYFKKKIKTKRLNRGEKRKIRHLEEKDLLGSIFVGTGK